MKNRNMQECVYVIDDEIDNFQIIQAIANCGLQEDAFYIFDIGEILRKHKQWKMMLPRVEPYYAVKCNDNHLVLQILASIGTNFDCASKVEIAKVLDVGVDSSHIVFANPAKPATQISYAKSTGVDLMTFDSETELHKVKSIFPTARLVLRLRCDAKIVQCPLGLKYGCNPLTEAPRLIQLAKLLGLNVVGISFHVGSGCGEPLVFSRAIYSAKILFDYALTLGYKFNILDIGGGFPGNKGSSLKTIADIVNGALQECFPDPSVRVIAEPGRFYAASAFTLATHVHSKREILSIEDNSVSHIMYYINDGIYGALNCVLHDHFHPEPVPLKGFSGKLISSSVWGPTCDSLDQVVEEVLLPPIEVGDWIIFESMGAYTMVAATEFNGFPQAKICTVIDRENWILLKNILHIQEDSLQVKQIHNHVNIQEWDISMINDTLPDCYEKLSSVLENTEEVNEGHCHDPAPTSFLYDFFQVGSVI